jgi:hypothetical protein
VLADVSTHVDWLKSVFRRQADVLTVAGGRVSTLLRVETGLMRGMREDFTSDTLSVGSAIGCDIVLMDDGVLPHHMTFHMRRSAFGVLVEVLAQGPVTIGTMTLDANETSGVHRLPQTLNVGEVTMTLANALVPEATQRRAQQVRTAGIVGIVCLVFAVALVTPLAQLFRSPEQRPLRIAPEETATPQARLAVDRAFRSSVEAELSRLQLKDNVNVDTADGLLSINGRIPAAKWTAWRSFTHWYDQQAGAPVLVQDVARATELASLKSVAAIRLSDPAEIRFVDGEILKIGDVVDDNWVISSISADGIVLTRGEDRTEIAF